jgi:flagellar operon protein
MVDNISFFPVLPGTEAKSPAKPQSAPQRGRSPFAELLDNTLPSAELRFSRHALDRLETRGIDLSETDLEKLRGAVDKVAQKGGKESLVLLGDSALVVSVKNRTVVTVLGRENMVDNVVTRIDSAVIL